MSFNPFSLKNKVIVITGASSGIGKQCAISCSKMGAKIILIARNSERLRYVMAELDGKEHIMHSFDVTSYDEIEAIIQDSVETLGKIDGFIHSAGLELTKPLRVMNIGDYEKIYSVNVFSGFEILKIISKKKYSSENASFIFISSIMGLYGQPGKVAYCSSKSALIGGAKALSLELAHQGKRVNCILPAVVETEMSKALFDNLTEQERSIITHMHPLGLGDCRDVANACIYLLSDASRWVTGTNLIIDGGYSAQ